MNREHRIAVISDTHNLLRPEVAAVIKTCDVVLHGGDISGPATFEKIRELCGESSSTRVGGAGNFYAVRGNNDRDWASEIPYTLEVTLYGLKFFMAHMKKDIPADADADVVIYGHSHRYAQEERNGTLYLNPGSCGPRRFRQPITMAVLTIAESGEASGPSLQRVSVEKIEIPHEDVKTSAPFAGQKAAATQKLSVAQKPVAAQKPLVTHKSSASQERELVSGDTIRKIGADIEKHRTISEIAARRNLSRELAEEIVRLYVTHPGVTPEQIMSKMGL